MMDMSNIKIDFWGEVNIEKMFDIHDNQKVEIYACGTGNNNENQRKASDNARRRQAFVWRSQAISFY